MSESDSEKGTSGSGVSLDDLINQDGPTVDKAVGTDIDLQKVDALLFAQDPTLRDQLGELKKPEIKGEIELDFFDEVAIDALDGKRNKVVVPDMKEKKPKASFKERVASGRARLKDKAKKLAPTPKNVSQVASANIQKVKSIDYKAHIAAIKSALGVFGKSLGGSLKGAKTSSKTAKLAFVGAMLLFMMLGFVVQRTMSGKLIGASSSGFVPTVAVDPDAAWVIDRHESEDDFFSTLRHPEHVVAIERLIVNITPSESSGENPMGYFDFYIEASTEEAAVEVNDRMAEVRDTMQRTLESITYDELITVEGKNKLKIVMRKNLNPVLTKGRVRKVYFKSIVIKP